MKTLFKTPALVLNIVAGLLITFASCKKDGNSEKQIKTPEQRCECENEIAYKDIPGEVVSFRNEAKNVTFELVKKGDKYILGGDIILTEAQLARLKGDTNSHARTGISTLANLWSNRTVFFTINPSLPDQWRITNAIAHWEDQTNLQFVARTTQPNYIEFVPSTGCASYYGMIGGRQEIFTGNGCSTGNLIHEIGHAIGFFHEQSRADRNSYINVDYSNIQAGAESNFHTYITLGIAGFEIGTFDFGSIMLYSSFAFSSNSLPTITRLDGSTFVGQRDGLSTGDIQTYNNMYNRPFLRVEESNYQENIPIQNGWRDYSYDIHVRAYQDAAMTIPATLTTPITFKVNMNWSRTGQPLYWTVTERTMQPGTNAVFCGTAYSEYTFPGGEIHESTVAYQIDLLMN